MFKADLQRLKDGLALCEKEPTVQSYNILHEYKFFESNGAFVRFVYNPNGCYVYLYSHGHYFDSDYTSSHKLEDLLIVSQRLIKLYFTALLQASYDWQMVSLNISICLKEEG